MAGPTTIYRLQRFHTARGGHDGQSRVIRADSVVIEETDGTELAAQAEVDGGHVLFLTYDNPFDEGLHVIYLDQADRLSDEARIGFLDPQGIGLLSELRVIDGRRIDFDFYGRWRLQIDPRGTISCRASPPGVRRPWRKWLSRRHLCFEAGGR